MCNGTFDDRDTARMAVKHWLHERAPHDYTPRNIRRLASEIIKRDSDPVDGVEETWRQTSYGIVKGIVEFAAEELEHPGEARAYGGGSEHRQAVLEAKRAAAALPWHRHRAVEHLSRALDLMTDGGRRAAALDRALVALDLALALLGRPQAVAA